MSQQAIMIIGQWVDGQCSRPFFGCLAPRLKCACHCVKNNYKAYIDVADSTADTVADRKLLKQKKECDFHTAHSTADTVADSEYGTVIVDRN